LEEQIRMEYWGGDRTEEDKGKEQKKRRV